MHTRENSNRLSRALSYAGRAQKTSFLTEKITFYCSALEALFSSSTTELSHQVAERVAIVASQSRGQRLANYKFVKECYGLRSKYIHGSPLKVNEEDRLSSICMKLDDLVREGMSNFLCDEEMIAASANKEKFESIMLQRLFS
jgi:hypothetical protein